MLYHKDVFMPSSVKSLEGKTFALRFSRHAMNACLNDRYGQILPPRNLTARVSEIIEIETQGNQIVKFVSRIAYNAQFDLMIVVMPDGFFGFVKTVWLNARTDSHKTLDRSKYASQ
jgi:hypothetical protein